MKKIKIVVVFLVLLSVFSCQKQPEHQFIYAFESPDDATTENLNRTIKVLDNRLTSYGLSHTIEPSENNTIMVKAYSNILKDEVLNRIITNKGKFEFWETFEGQEIYRDLFVAQSDIESETKINSILNSAVGVGYPGQPILFYINPADTLSVIKRLDSLKQKMTGNKRFVKFLYGNPREDKALPLYTIKSNRENKPVITGNVIVKAAQNYDMADRPVIDLRMNKDGALQWERVTGKAYRENRQIAMVINDVVYSAPGLSNGAIKGGKSQISGDLSVQEAFEFTVIISGKEEIPKLKLLSYAIQAQ